MKYEYKPYNYSPTDDEIIEDLQKVSTSFDLSKLTMQEYDEHGSFNTSTIIRRFGSWNNALLKAKIEITQQFWEEEQLFENLENVWRKNGSQPRRRDMDNKELSYISSGSYTRKYGRWSNALREFIDYINQDDDNQTNELIITNAHHTEHSHCTKRDVNLRLRFKVLQRDNFKCCMCGAAPAKDPAVELHIDHIIPWSKGGETTIDNLQTLCSKCNLGKSDLL